jgi:apolipoprotein N-acyltransferase
MTRKLPSWVLLAAGAALAFSTGPRWSIAPLAWLAPIPYLLFARQARGVKPWLALLGTMLVGYSIQCATMATAPMPLIAMIMFGPPMALIRFGAIGLGELVRRRLGESAGLIVYVAATVSLDWLGYGVAELGAWMATSQSQVEQLTFLQLASIAGLAGLAAIMAWTAGTLASVIAGAMHPSRIAIVAATLTAIFAWGTFRADRPLPGRSITVAAIATTVGPDENGMPDAPTLARNTDDLFARTRLAAARGARIVVWNEVATLIEPADDAAFIARARATARELRIDLVLAYAVHASHEPLLLDNKYLFIDERGEILDSYQKHHPVPGEPSIRGEGPLRVLERPYGKVGGAICYDYDFPAMAREHALADAELILLPSSDWRGIDPVHTFMARVRAIEGGFSLVRSVRWAASAAYDARGRVRAWMPAIDDNDGIMIASVPVGRTATLAPILGDIPAWIAGALVAIALFASVRTRARRPRTLEA